VNEEPDVAASAPRAEITLPDGQRLQARVTRRRRDRSGVWWYDLTLDVPDREDDRRHGPTLTARTITFSAPHPLVQPIAGEDYRSLDPPPPGERKRWRLDDAPMWMRAEFLVHRLDCAQAHGEHLLTDQEVLQMLADPEAAACCEVCRPETLLPHRPHCGPEVSEDRAD
jgi:hypothetical protein